jgi:hypothetical protein
LAREMDKTPATCNGGHARPIMINDAKDDLEEGYNCPIPRLPREPPQKEHRPRKPIHTRIGYASVARSVNKEGK